jgi:hypothetical protein
VKRAKPRCAGCNKATALVVFECEGGYCLKCSALLIKFVRAA